MAASKKGTKNSTTKGTNNARTATKKSYERADLSKLTKKDLLNIASELSLKNISSLKKDSIIEKILEASGHPEKVTKQTPRRKLRQDDLSIEMKGASKKYELEEPSNFVEPSYPIETRELPKEYGDTKIALMIRDPYWAFVYWGINDKTREELDLQRNNHDKQILLRVYDVTGVNFDGFNANQYFDIDVNDYAISWYINLPSPNRSYCVDLGFYNENGEFVLIARSNIVTSPRDSVSDIIDEEWMVIDDYFKDIYRLSGGYRIHEIMGSENISKILQERLEFESSSGLMSSGAFASSMQVPTEERAKGFWLVVNCELIVYGATEPDAKVTVQGREIQLREDGTFSMRFALPDGTQVIPVKAVSADGDDTRQITPIVNRKTE